MRNPIRKNLKCVLCLAGAAAMVGASIAPAAARDHSRYPGYGYGYGGSWYGSPYRHRHHHRHRGLDAGDVIGIAALIGAVAIIASSANKDKKARSGPDRRYDDRGYDDDAYESERDDYRGSASEDEAVTMCASAARDKAESQSGGYAEIVDVDRPRAVGSDGWSVDGRLEQRSGYRGEDRETRRFSCDVRGGRVAEVYISRDVI